jgi:regulator of sirC expression with transglutaminase-like and TPR domain
MDADCALSILAGDPAAPLDVAEVALALARDEYPTLDADGYLSELAAMAGELRPRLRGPLAARVAALTRYLFDDLGFGGDRRDYYDPRNSYLNEVLDRRAGLPITLSLVAMAVGRRAGLTVGGVGLPGHFVARADDGGATVFFDPYHGGRVLGADACARLVRETTGQPFAPTAEALAPVPPGPMVARMLMNLKGTYLRRGDFGRGARVIARLLQLAPGNPVQRRDLGAALAQGGQPGKAIAHLQAYLDAVPAAPDADDVTALLRRARAAVARWN